MSKSSISSFRKNPLLRIFSKFNSHLLSLRCGSRYVKTPKIPAGGSFELWRPFQTQSIDEVHTFFKENPESSSPTGKVDGRFHGRCYVCGRESVFEVQIEDKCINWRETLKCQNCNLINRWRSCFHLFELICTPSPDSNIFITEAITPLHDLISGRYPRTKGSEYSPSGTPGQEMLIGSRRVEMQDVTRLTFTDRSFDCILCFDVLEHVPCYERALGEFGRVLKSGGFLLLSVPFTFQQDTELRAIVRDDGSIHHILPQEFHGDPMTGSGVLCYQTFGMDLLGTLNAAGFRGAYLCCYTAPEWAYLGANVLYVAQKS